jgi:uncharacterized protein YprB with RNaseH-like and TPR domain
MGAELTFVAFDIETTGFEADDELTVAGFALPDGCRICCRTDGRPTPGLERVVDDRVQESVTVSTYDSEPALLEAIRDIARHHLQGEDVLLVAYNGEVYRSGFDLPFLRTRLARHDVAWPFTDLPYADLLPVLRDKFNTTVGEESRTTLPAVYEVLLDGEYNDLDPFQESAEAVTAYEAGRFEALVTHNLADILRTAALGQLSQHYCSKSDYQLKSLTPTVES